jgi:hypothetical protein
VKAKPTPKRPSSDSAIVVISGILIPPVNRDLY